MELGLKNKRVFISASSGGIGFAVAEEFLSEGAMVIINGRDESRLNKSYESLTKKYSSQKVYSFAGNMASPSVIKYAAEYVKDRLGGIDILVSNLGSGKPENGNKWDRGEWKRLLDINLLSAVSIIDEFILLFGKDGGSILLMSSLAGFDRIEAPPAYAVAKAGINVVVSYAAREFAPLNIRVNGVAPGNVYFEGGRWEELKNQNETIVSEYIKNDVPMKCFVTPKEVASGIVFLSSDKSKYTTGEILHIDGGQHRSF